MSRTLSDIVSPTSNPKVISFVIPLYNSARWLEKCIYSVLNQDIPESQMEIICVNDGSPDNSAEMARSIAQEHPSIIVIDQPNQGPSGARNTGMRHATGKYLAFVDPDDFVEPNVFGKLVRQMEDEQLDMLRFNYQIVDEQYRLVEKRPFEKAFDYSPKLMTGAEFIATRLDIACNIWRYLYRREIITSNNIWCYTGDYIDDTPWLPMVLLKVERMTTCSVVVYNYLERPDSLIRIQTSSMITRRMNGSLLLLKQLEYEIADIRNGRVEIAVRWQEDVIAWYKMIEAHLVVSFLTRVGVSKYAERKSYLQQLNALNLFPLSMNRANRKIVYKLRLANTSPVLFVWLTNLKYSFHHTFK